MYAYEERNQETDPCSFRGGTGSYSFGRAETAQGAVCGSRSWRFRSVPRLPRLLIFHCKAPKNHMSIQMLQTTISGLPLALGLGTRMSDPCVYEVFWAHDSWNPGHLRRRHPKEKASWETPALPMRKALWPLPECRETFKGKRLTQRRAHCPLQRRQRQRHRPSQKERKLQAPFQKQNKTKKP